MSKQISPAIEQPEEQTDEEILSELLERTAYGLSRSSDIRAQGDLNMRALSIQGPWPPEELSDRQKIENRRPHGHTDIIGPNNSRIKNQWRMRPRGVKVDATGEGASRKTAELRESRIREIAYHSQAKSARTCCIENVVDRGYGCWEVYAEYESPRSNKQVPRIGRIPNPNSVIIDPDTTKADRSDMQWAVKMGRTMSESAFKRKYKNARDLSSFPAETLGLCTQFTDGQKTVTPAEYFRVVTKERTLLTLDTQPAQDIFEDELQRHGYARDGEFVVGEQGLIRIAIERVSEFPRLEKFVTNGLQILSRSVLPISTVPIIYVVASEKYEDDVLTIEAPTAKQREPQLNFDITRAAQIEAINQVPKSKWVVSDEQILGYEDSWKNAHRNPTAYLVVHEYDRNGRQMARPERTDYSPPVEALELVANAFMRDVQNASGSPSASVVDRVSKSGVAQEKINESTDITNFHIPDNMDMGIEYEGRILNEWLSVIEDSERTVGLRKPDGKYIAQRIVPTETEGKIQHPYGPSESHAVTIGTGPDYQSQRAEKVDFLKQMVAKPEFITSPLSPMVIHEAELGPGGDKMEKVALSVQPPAVQAAYAEEGEEGQVQLPPEVLQQIEQKNKELSALNEHAKQLEQKVIELEDDIRAQKIKADSDERISAEDNATTLEKTQADNAAKIEIERMKLEHAERMKQYDIEIKKIDLEREKIRGSIQAEMQGMKQDHESSENAATRDAKAKSEVENIG